MLWLCFSYSEVLLICDAVHVTALAASVSLQTSLLLTAQQAPAELPAGQPAPRCPG